jgi:Holliday junction resolvase RusA-like endonuclease
LEAGVMLEFHLPYPPSVNHYWRRVGPRTLISRGGRLFRKQVCAILASQRVQPLAGPLEVQVKLYPPDRRRRDVDNTLKAVLDALQHGGAYEDDNQIVRLAIEKCERTPGGKAVVRISEIEDQ